MENSVTAVAPWNKDNANQPFVKEKVKDAAHKIFMQIATGRYSFGARLDAERHLAEELGLTRTTIRQAFDFLEHYDVVKRRRTVGPLSSTVPLVPARTSPQTKFLLMPRRLTSWTSKPLWRRRHHSR